MRAGIAQEQRDVYHHPYVWLIKSLNLGTTSGIVFYEITKQRREYHSQYKRAGKRRKKPSA